MMQNFVDQDGFNVDFLFLYKIMFWMVCVYTVCSSFKVLVTVGIIVHVSEDCFACLCFMHGLFSSVDSIKGSSKWVEMKTLV